MDTLLNDILLSKDIVNSMFSLDDKIVSSCDAKATDICKVLFPKIDLSREENIELVIRPMSAVIALNELLLENIFSMSSIDGVYESTTIPDRIKSNILLTYAKMNGIKTLSSSVEAIYSEIKFNIKSKSMNIHENVVSAIYEHTSDIDRLLFVDGNMIEMSRSKLSYVQINTPVIMNFKRNTTNSGSLIDAAYSRADMQRYNDYLNSNKIDIPGMLDIYYSTLISTEDITIVVGADGRYTLPVNPYISITHSSKNISLLLPDVINRGISPIAAKIYVVNGDNTETFTVTKYIPINFSSMVDFDTFTILDIFVKCFYPLFVDFTVYTKGNVDSDRILSNINLYLATIDGDMSMVSHNDMANFVSAGGDSVSISSTNHAECFTKVGVSFESMITFPLTMKDLVVPLDLRDTALSARTIKIFARSINVIQE